MSRLAAVVAAVICGFDGSIAVVVVAAKHVKIVLRMCVQLSSGLLFSLLRRYGTKN